MTTCRIQRSGVSSILSMNLMTLCQSHVHPPTFSGCASSDAMLKLCWLMYEHHRHRHAATIRRQPTVQSPGAGVWACIQAAGAVECAAAGAGVGGRRGRGQVRCNRAAVWAALCWHVQDPMPNHLRGNQSRKHHTNINKSCRAVDRFYKFWFGFKSWREFPHPDEEDIEQAECREDRCPVSQRLSSIASSVPGHIHFCMVQACALRLPAMRATQDGHSRLVAGKEVGCHLPLQAVY
jgi:hypothetical protein